MHQPKRLECRVTDWRGEIRPDLIREVTPWYTAHLIRSGALPPEPGPVRGDVFVFEHEGEWE